MVPTSCAMRTTPLGQNNGLYIYNDFLDHNSPAYITTYRWASAWRIIWLWQEAGKGDSKIFIMYGFCLQMSWRRPVSKAHKASNWISFYLEAWTIGGHQAALSIMPYSCERLRLELLSVHTSVHTSVHNSESALGIPRLSKTIKVTKTQLNSTQWFTSVRNFGNHIIMAGTEDFYRRVHIEWNSYKILNTSWYSLNIKFHILTRM